MSSSSKSSNKKRKHESDDEKETPAEIRDKKLSAFRSERNKLEEKTNGTYILFGYPYIAEEVKLSDVNQSLVLSKDHILLPKDIGKIATDISHSINKDWREHMGGATSIGNYTWSEYYFPISQKAKRLVKEEKWHEAVGNLMGLVLHMAFDDQAVTDNEVYMEEERFSGYFRRISNAWKTVLAEGDDTLGFAIEGGKEGGYRSRIVKLLTSCQKDVNDRLKGVYDHSLVLRRTRIRIFPLTKEEEVVAYSDDEEEDDESEDVSDNEDSDEGTYDSVLVKNLLRQARMGGLNI